MYKNRLTVYGEHLASEQVLPANAEAMGNGGSRRAGGTMGATEVVMVAMDAVRIPEGGTLTLSLEQSADDTVYTPVPVLFRRKEQEGDGLYGAGEVLARLPMPSDTAAHVKAKMTTDVAGVTGRVNVLFEYLPR